MEIGGDTTRHRAQPAFLPQSAMNKMQSRRSFCLFLVWLVSAVAYETSPAATDREVEASVPTAASRQRFDQFKVMADHGDAVAQYNLGACYHNGDGVEQDAKEAARWFRQAALQGNATAQYHLGLSLVNGHGAPANVVEGAQWYRKAADQGLAQAQFDLGICYRDGVGVGMDLKQAVAWFHKAAVHGSAEAQQGLGMAYSQGAGVPQDQAEAFRWFFKAAEQGDPYAQHDVGLCYRNGEGVVQDSAEAVKWFSKSAEQGLPAAEHDLGVCFATDNGVTNDEEKAIKWFRRAANHGDADSQLRLGVKLELRKEWAEAAAWYLKAASQGVASAQVGVAGCYARGLGVAKDLPESYKWLAVAAAAGHPDSANVLKVVAGMMTPDQIAEGQRRAQLFLHPPAAVGSKKTEHAGADQPATKPAGKVIPKAATSTPPRRRLPPGTLWQARDNQNSI